MKICNKCNHATVGDPLFCNHCGSSYDIKLCPRLHVNPRAAQVCSQCGSRDFSSPHPKTPLLAKPLLLLLTNFTGFLLLTSLMVLSIAFVHYVATDPNALVGLISLGLLLGVLVFLWMQLPKFLRNGIKSLFTRDRKAKKE